MSYQTIKSTQNKMKGELVNLRPNAGNGFWVGLILPISIALSFIKYNIEASKLYQQCFLFSVGVLCTTILLITKYRRNKSLIFKVKHLILPTVGISIIFFVFLNKGFLFSCYSGILSSIVFCRCFTFLLKTCPFCFTFGEALFCSQGFIIFIYSTTTNLYYVVKMRPKTYLEISTFIIQMGVSSIALICFLAYKYKCFRTTKCFYAMSVMIIVFILLLPLQILLRQNPLVWIFKFLTKDRDTILMIVYWVICSACAVYAVSKQIKGAKRASTVVRKSFHMLALLVFLPGIIYECSLIYLASGVVLGIFIALELLRNLNVPPMGAILQDGFMVFSDDKDIGAVALTPIYLLVGCSLPLWIHPAPCNVMDSAGFDLLSLLSGLLSVGVGDSLASCVGSFVGRHKWSGSSKTIEGTLACILGQIFMVYALSMFGEYNEQEYDVIKILIAVVTVAVVEAKTTQVDNLILPLLMYCILL